MSGDDEASELRRRLKDTQAQLDAVQADLRELLGALGMGDHARPQSLHEVFQECIQEVRRERERLDVVATFWEDEKRRRAEEKERADEEKARADKAEIERDACCFGCPCCGADHRGGLAITELRRPIRVGATEYTRAIVCPEKGRSILLDREGQEAVEAP